MWRCRLRCSAAYSSSARWWQGRGLWQRWDARLLFAGALFPLGAGAEENDVPQRLVVEGPYRYVRNPLYDTDLCLILGAGLLAHSWALVLLAVLYLAQLALQLPLEERELKERFGVPYHRYCELVPRFVPRRRPVDQRDLHS